MEIEKEIECVDVIDSITYKKCCKCHEELSLDSFNKNSNTKDGKMYACRKCQSIKKREHYSRNKESYKIMAKKYKESNPDSYLDTKRRYRENNQDKIKNSNKLYRENNKEKIKESKTKYKQKKYNTDVIYRVNHSISSSIRRVFKLLDFKKKIKSIDIIGCSLDELKLYFESKFEPWMNWDNYGGSISPSTVNMSWDIDHIIPVSTAKTEEDIIKLNHYTNLQPLCSYVNRHIKKDRIIN